MIYTTIVDASVLSRHLDDPNWIVLDCQHDLMKPGWGREAYAAGHIPGAQFVSLDDDLAGAKNGSNGRHPLPSVESLTALFSRLGISEGKQVVVYDSAQSMYAGRAWWCLKWMGHQAVAVLDGGLGKWKLDGRALSTDMPAARPATFVARINAAIKVEGDEVAARMKDGSARIIDARAPDRYDGSAETIDPVGGHIPGAVNRFWKSNVNPDGTFKPAAVLRAEFEALLAGKTPAEVIQQCGSGVTALHNFVAMEIAGLSGSRLYPGSWSEWCANPARPVATGSQP
ncbi:MAG: Rhodanese-like protein [Betaproteobacteria bacterium]|nr:Rhodanese-like protein [Betaproteobacteria bacterium]